MDFSRRRCASCSSPGFPGLRKDLMKNDVSDIFLGRPISALPCTTKTYTQVAAPNRRPTSGSVLQLYDKKNTRGQLPPYFSFNDPHLRDFYLRKFFAIAQNDLLRSGILRATSLSSHSKANTKRTKLGFEQEARYTVSLTTGKHPNAGTSARAFISLFGLKGKVIKKRLVKKGTLGVYSFLRGKVQSFKFGGSDVGKIGYIIIEHDGVLEKDGWFLEKVEVIKTILKNRKSTRWTFPCNDWLSLHASDGLIKRKLFTENCASKPNSTFADYQVVVVTGDVKGSGTDAHVFLTIFGTQGQTDKIHLSNSSNDFKRASTSKFNFKAGFVGLVNKIRIEHDNTGFAPGWFLERVIITDLNSPSKQYYFPCKQWLAKDEGDGAISKDLLACSDLSETTQKSKKYKILVYTGDKKGAGTDANVSIQLFGTLTDSGIKMLDARFKNDFERNKVDEFTVESIDLGELKRIRIGHDNTGPSPGWFLEKVEVFDDERNKKYDFPCHRWLAKDEDDGETYRDLTCGQNKHGFPYEIRVKTGDVFNAGTSAKVFIVMYGGLKQDDDDDDDDEGFNSKGNKSQKKLRKLTSQENVLKTSGKLWLTGCKFERNRTDICRVEVMEDLSPLQKIEIGHDNQGFMPGWFLDEVIVCCLRSGIEQTFPCKQWLALNEGDGIIERTLHENGRITREQKVTWSVRVHTCDEIGAGTDANVFFVLYGKKPKNKREKSDVTYLKSRDIQLGNKSNNFESGQVDVFVVEVEEVGFPIKLRVWRDNSKPFASWKLWKMELENHKTKESFTFTCNRWLSEDEDDKEIIRELPLDNEAKNKVLKYKVFVHTGKILGAGTDANVFICIYGENGDTGDRPLKHCLNNSNKFERGQVDEFVVEAVDLKELKRIRIGHDGKHAGSGWFLEKVVVQCIDVQDGSSNKAIVFECNRWLDTKEDDGQIVREFLAGGIQMLNTTSYHISVRTGTCRHAGTDANVYVQLFGGSGSTGKLKLVESESGNKNKFESGRVDLFVIEAIDIGEIKKILIGHDGAGAGSGWFLEEVTVKVPSRGEIYEFPCGRWLDEKEDDGLLERELFPGKKLKDANKCIPYCITVWTGDKSGAGTDANVFMQMYGDLAKSEEIQLRNKSDNFERGSKEVFKIEAVDVGKIFKIRVGHDGTGMFSGWFLHKLLIQCFQTNNKQKLRPKRIQDKNETKFRDRIRHKPGHTKHRSSAVNFKDVPASNKSRKTNGKHLKSSLSYDYDDDDDDEDEEDGDCSYVDDEELANVRRVYKEHQNRSSSPNEGTSRSSNGEEDSDETSSQCNDVNEYWFVCDKWFATTKGDGKIVRELLPTTAEGETLKNSLHEIMYIVKVFTGTKFGAGTDANVFLKLSGSRGDSGEIHLKESNNANKFERKQVDIFKVSAVDLGILTKLQIRHDNKGGNAGWYLDHIEVEDTKNNLNYYFECKKWLAIDEDDGQLSRVLVPRTESNKQAGDLVKQNSFLKEKEVKADKAGINYIRYHISLRQTKAVAQEGMYVNYMKGNILSESQKVQASMVTTYRVKVFTGNKFGAGTDANVHIIMYGEKDDTGKILLKNSKSNKNKFERNQVDEFSVEAADLGDIKKIRIGHDNKGFGGAWFLDKVVIEAPSADKKWIFPHSRWIAKEEDDGKLEHEILAQR